MTHVPDDQPGEPGRIPIPGGPGDEPALQALGITKSFGVVRALRAVDLEVRAGEVLAVMGENGAGKSTLLKILTGDHQPDEGTILLHGASVRFTEPQASRAAGLRVIAQEPEIVPHVSVAENIYLGDLRRTGRWFSRAAVYARARKDLARFGFETVIRPETLGSALSPAQRQVVEIMRALVDEPSVICFDEPTSSLGDAESEILFRLIRRLRDEGVAIAYVSHRMAEIFALADRITVLRDGALVGTKRADETDHAELVRMMVGRDLTQFFQRAPATHGEEVLRLEGVGNEHVHDIDLTVRAGEVVGIAGLVGAGRSELMKTIVGDLRVRTGSMSIRGRRVRFRSPADAINAGIGFAPEERKAEALVLGRPVRDNVALASMKRLSHFGFMPRAEERKLADRYVERLRIRTPSSDQLVGKLSGGNQQKVVIARWLATDPQLLVLDEPTRGIDVGAKSEIYDIVEELAQAGVAVIIVSSELPEVLGLADRICVMAGGRITGELVGPEATEEAVLALAMDDGTVSSPSSLDHRVKSP